MTREKAGKTERLIIQEIACQLGLLICENNRLRYVIDRKNHEIDSVLTQIKSKADLTKDDIIGLLENIIDRPAAGDSIDLPDGNLNAAAGDAQNKPLPPGFLDSVASHPEPKDGVFKPLPPGFLDAQQQQAPAKSDGKPEDRPQEKKAN